MGRPLFPPPIHRKIICMWSNFHKTTIEHWQRTPIPRKANQSLQNKVGQNIKIKRETKDLGLGTHSEEGVVKEEKFPHSRNPLTGWVSREEWDVRGQRHLKEKKRKASAGSKWGLGENALVAASSFIRVRTVVECPEFTVRGLM